MDREQPFFMEAVREVHANVVTIDTIAGVFDDDGNEITIDETAVQAKIDQWVAEAPLVDLRFVRDNKLAETDWWASSDLTMTTAQTNYRQALRDITNTYSDLDTVVWPTKP